MAKSKTDTNQFDQDRRSLLTALLDNVPFDGWTDRAVTAATDQAGLERGFAYRAFPRGPLDAIIFFNQVADAEMVASLQNQDLDAMRIRDRIIQAIRNRLEQNASHRDAIRRGVTVLAFPANAPVGLQCLYRTVDTIWRAAGDTSTDFNFYTKRTLLAGVYSSTLVYWLNDNSDDFERTWSFLDRRIEDVLRVSKLTTSFKEATSRMPDPFAVRDFLRRTGLRTLFR
ncbi:MAG: COQ9 family protein [Rhodospirillaceae bacterium]|nr:COQ9 family protein [Rhodospirillaceae bacterium]